MYILLNFVYIINMLLLLYTIHILYIYLYMSKYSIFAAGSDASVVRRTQARLQAQHKPTAHYSAYFTVPTRFIFLLFAFFGKLLETLAQFSWGRTLLLRFPRVFSYGLFSRDGPTERQMAQTRFEMRFIGHGYAQGTFKHLHNVETRFYCPQTFLSLYFQCTDNL